VAKWVGQKSNLCDMRTILPQKLEVRMADGAQSGFFHCLEAVMIRVWIEVAIKSSFKAVNFSNSRDQS
jgi:hypothetical protein